MDITQELRLLADGIPEDETVSLPACRASEWPKREVHFEDVKISGLLRFIADMCE